MDKSLDILIGETLKDFNGPPSPPSLKSSSEKPHRFSDAFPPYPMPSTLQKENVARMVYEARNRKNNCAINEPDGKLRPRTNGNFNESKNAISSAAAAAAGISPAVSLPSSSSSSSSSSSPSAFEQSCAALHECLFDIEKRKEELLKPTPRPPASSLFPFNIFGGGEGGAGGGQEDESDVLANQWIESLIAKMENAGIDDKTKKAAFPEPKRSGREAGLTGEIKTAGGRGGEGGGESLSNKDNGKNYVDDDENDAMRELMLGLFNTNLIVEPIEKVKLAFEEWLQKNKSGINKKELERYERQKSIIDEIIHVCKTFNNDVNESKTQMARSAECLINNNNDTFTPGPSEKAKHDRLKTLIEELHNLGELPDDVIQSMFSLLFLNNQNPTPSTSAKSTNTAEKADKQQEGRINKGGASSMEGRENEEKNKIKEKKGKREMQGNPLFPEDFTKIDDEDMYTEKDMQNFTNFLNELCESKGEAGEDLNDILSMDMLMKIAMGEVGEDEIIRMLHQKMEK